MIATAAAQQPPLNFPFEPAQLLGVLPTAPAEWKTTSSEAETTLGEWLETRATRVFQAPPPPATSAGSAPISPPGEVEITIVDTAGFKPALAAFHDFVPGKNGSLEKTFIGSLPAMTITNEGGRQFTQVLVSSRYIVEITLIHLPRHRVEDWLRGFRFDTLPTTGKGSSNQPREFRLSHFDELQPRNNRSYAVSKTVAQKVNDFLQTLPATPNSEP